MPLETDAVLDRRLLRRKVTFWRALSIFAVIVAVAVAGLAGAQRFGWVAPLQHVARVEVKGVITQNANLVRTIEALGRNRNVRAVIVTIDSPGGTVAGSEALYTAIRTVAAAKPTVAVVEGTAASGGYIAAIGTDHIVTRETSIAGSIGVVAQFPNVVRLLDTIGVRVEAVRSSPLKAMPSGVEPTSPEALAALREIITDSYDWFQRIVKERRGLTDEQLRIVADGRVFVGRRALDLRLTDQIGGEPEARAWLATKGVPATMRVQLHRPASDTNLSWLRSISGSLAEAAGLADWAERIRSSALATQIERSSLDGLLALWQPPTP
ncbi:signal peptide peptidase SppA [Phreatobacter cathodiphilus]|uniref:Signal peptide peptidase SppA n=1 Tax=Phreatobacter cathodiphilus TaxID=1868589 RepID=A0A2S0N7V0_9HYPH|nr:signal peptide peptidase SppA [Phreatobacter cathodiphilus]AVO44228.1 signal peptide peptidase SppA [Phreatobacter cathodiphilus]